MPIWKMMALTLVRFISFCKLYSVLSSMSETNSIESTQQRSIKLNEYLNSIKILSKYSISNHAYHVFITTQKIIKIRFLIFEVQCKLFAITRNRKSCFNIDVRKNLNKKCHTEKIESQLAPVIICVIIFNEEHRTTTNKLIAAK